MDKRYDHTKNEEKIYKLWEKSGAFTPKIARRKKPFTIIMPPPNANDPLHIGHARFVAIEDVLVRYHRMKNIPTLWLPGADHAGIETQYVFEKKLAKKGKSRFDYSRDTLYKMIWDYVQKNKEGMENQLRILGASCDWSRSKFTLDPDVVKIVYQTFKKLYDEGLVYRGERIVNFCPRCGTSFSELEVSHIEREDPMYYLDYGPVTIATVRPETIFADVAVAVNPKDNKYKKLVGKAAILPLVKRKLPIIADSLVDPEFGTGALKITPGHDHVDFEIGQKHKLSTVSVIDKKGKMINTPAKYIGMSIKKAREVVVEDLSRAGKIKTMKKIKHTVGVCYRDKGLIEPLVSKQWFIKTENLTKHSLSVIKKRKINFTTKRFEKIAKHWLKNLKDWNISRQIVWGIRIPAWRCGHCLEWTITDGPNPSKCSTCGHKKLTQDTDTFDTWFSSGQWPFATLQTTKKGDFDYFYPTSIMETGYDILPFWVIRMIMLGIYKTGEIPFSEVLLHGLVRDAHGEKISKSKGNVVDPLEMVNKYGADALRMGLIWGALLENDIALSENNIKGQRNFSNKIWNIARFVLQNEKTPSFPARRRYASSAAGGQKPNRVRRPRAMNEDDRWIMNELKITIKKATRSLDKYRLNEAAREIYDFVWHKFADVYIEKTKDKREESQQILEYLLQDSLRLLHPFMPFVTETIWSLGFARKKQSQPLGGKQKGLLINQSWPKF